MRRFYGLLSLLAACATTPTAPAVTSSSGIATRRVDASDTLHGVAVPDPYRWLEDASKPDVSEWMKVHDARARAHLAALPGREMIEKRLTELIYVDEIFAPIKRGERYFYSRRAKDVEKAIVYTKDGVDGQEKVLLDPNTIKEDGMPVSLGVFEPSHDGRTVVYALRPNNADEATLYLMDVETGRNSQFDVIEGAKYAEPSWTPDDSGFYYTWLPTDPSIPVADRPGYAEVRFHKLGTKASADIIIHERLNDPTAFIDARVTRDGKWLFFNIWHGWAENELFVRPAPAGVPTSDWDPKADWTLLSGGHKSLFLVEDYKDRFYIATNHEASNWRVLAIDPGKWAFDQWSELIPEGDAVLSDFKIVGGHFGLTFLRNAASELRVHDLSGKLVRKVALPTLGTASRFIGEPDDDEAFFYFSSFTYPREIYRTSISSGATSVYTRLDVPIDSSAFEVEQVWFPSKDGTKVSMFIVSKKGLEQNGANPTLLYGYGGFNISITPQFKALLYPWLEQGGVYAVPNLRGGGEYGEAWHQAGMLTNKQNVFDDYVAAAEYLIANKYTNPDKLAIYGRSNGGLLVGAAMTQRPDLYRAVICGVPLLDMVRYHLFGSGKTWIPEYGSAEDEAQFKAIVKYSPYNNVVAADYPSLLMLSTDHDDRVDPMHARKFVAAVDHATTGKKITLLRIEMNAGHGGADQRKSAVDKGVDMLSYLMRELGMK